MFAFLSQLDDVAAAALVAAALWQWARRSACTDAQRRGAWSAAAGVMLVAFAAGFGSIVGPRWETAPAWGGAALAIAGLAVMRRGGGLFDGLPDRRRHVGMGFAVVGIALSLLCYRLGWPGKALPVGLGAALLLWCAVRHETAPHGRSFVRLALPPARALVWAVVWTAAAAYLQVANAAADRMLTPTPRLPMRNADAPERLGWERVHFAAADGVPLVGWWMEGPRPAAVIICHGHGDNKGAYVPFMLWLRQVGWSVFAFDLRTHGESGGRVPTLGVHEQRDLEAAVDITLTRQARMPGGSGAPVVVFAYSMGGTVATPVVARDLRIAGMVIEGSSPFPLRNLERVSRNVLGVLTPVVLPGAFGLVYARTGAWIPSLRSIEAVGDISPRPVLFVHGRRDALPVASAREFYDAAGDPKQFFEAPNSRHVAAFFDDYPAYSRIVVDFLNRFPAGEPAG